MDGIVRILSEGLPAGWVSMIAATGYLVPMIINTFYSLVPRIKWYLWQLGVPGLIFLLIAVILAKKLGEGHWAWFAGGFVLLIVAASCGITGLWQVLRIFPALWHSACLLAVCAFLALHLSVQAGFNGQVTSVSLFALRSALVFLVLLILALAIRGVRRWHQWRMSRWFNVPVEKYYGDPLP